MKALAITNAQYPNLEFEYWVDFATALVKQRPNETLDAYLKVLAKYKHFKALNDKYRVMQTSKSVVLQYKESAYAHPKVYAVIS